MSLVEEMFRSKIWTPPERSEGQKKRAVDDCDVFLKIISGPRVHARLFSNNDSVSLKHYKSTNRLILYFHGNAEDIHATKTFLAWLSVNTQCNVLAVDYVGYGRSCSTEVPTEQNMHETAEALLEYATATLGHKMHTVSLMGRSLGSIPAVYLASKPENAGLQGLVLISGLASGARCVLPSAYTPRLLQATVDGVFGANILRIPGVQCMILFVHGDADAVVGLQNSIAMKEKSNRWCQAEVFVVRGGTHDDLWTKHANGILARLNDFLASSFENARLHASDPEARAPYEPDSAFPLDFFD